MFTSGPRSRSFMYVFWSLENTTTAPFYCLYLEYLLVREVFGRSWVDGVGVYVCLTTSTGSTPTSFSHVFDVLLTQDE